MMPHNLNIQELVVINITSHANQSDCNYITSIIRLPTLTKLTLLMPLHPDVDLSLLQSLPMLRDLFVGTNDKYPTIAPDDFASGLSRLHQLTSLSVRYERIRSSHLQIILASMTKLKSLRLLECESIDSLSSLPMLPALEKLEVCSCSKLSAAEINLFISRHANVVLISSEK